MQKNVAVLCLSMKLRSWAVYILGPSHVFQDLPSLPPDRWLKVCIWVPRSHHDWVINMTGWWFFALPLWKMMEWKSVGMMTFPTEWKVINFMFQTTNQMINTQKIHQHTDIWHGHLAIDQLFWSDQGQHHQIYRASGDRRIISFSADSTVYINPLRKLITIGLYDGFLSHGGTPNYHPFYSQIFPFKQSILGCCHLWKLPYGKTNPCFTHIWYPQSGWIRARQINRQVAAAARMWASLDVGDCLDWWWWKQIGVNCLKFGI